MPQSYVKAPESPSSLFPYLCRSLSSSTHADRTALLLHALDNTTPSSCFQKHNLFRCPLGPTRQSRYTTFLGVPWGPRVQAGTQGFQRSRGAQRPSKKRMFHLVFWGPRDQADTPQQTPCIPMEHAVQIPDMCLQAEDDTQSLDAKAKTP